MTLSVPITWYLTADDSCVFFGEYTARAGYGHSSTNQLIHNLKKKPELDGTPQYVWKARAIRTVADAIRANLRPDSLPGLTIVPVPPSTAPGEAGYDDRMVQVARAIAPGVDVREVLVTVQGREAAHAQQNHRDPAELRASLGFVQARVGAPPPVAVILDDVLTTGCSFMVCKAMLAELWPETRFLGLFVARRVIDSAADFDVIAPEA
ncbi:hypothetical protein [Phenylobacterium sp.]|uniref:hypothetical protein n=1 Tax=Phenylobacterium sp. TaxID=1871053 RepID=UPI0035AE4ECF